MKILPAFRYETVKLSTGYAAIAHRWWCWAEFGGRKSFVFRGSTLESTVGKSGAGSHLQNGTKEARNDL